ncbi:MAG: hypothetical protein Q7S79_01865 [bacterium]|nr:hypothetical protein [bacterium]
MFVKNLLLLPVIVFMLTLAVLVTVTTNDAQAKLLPRANSSGSSGAVQNKPRTSAPVAGRVAVSVKFKSGKSGIVATFSNLDAASNVSYSLTYTSRGIKEGVGGSIPNPSGTQTRELLFATCSGSVCRYHTGITNAKFTVTTTLKNGKKVVKPFKLRV